MSAPLIPAGDLRRPRFAVRIVRREVDEEGHPLYTFDVIDAGTGAVAFAGGLTLHVANGGVDVYLEPEVEQACEADHRLVHLLGTCAVAELEAVG